MDPASFLSVVIGRGKKERECMEGCVEKLEKQVQTLLIEVGALRSEVSALQSEVSALRSERDNNNGGNNAD